MTVAEVAKVTGLDVGAIALISTDSLDQD